MDFLYTLAFSLGVFLALQEPVVVGAALLAIILLEHAYRD